MLSNINIQNRLVAIRNEQRAQKASSVLNYGQLVLPENTPTKSWYGNVSNTMNISEGVTARWVATFTRSDEIHEPPLVDFAWDFTLDKGNYQDLIQANYITSTSGRDIKAVDEIKFSEGLHEVGDNYIKWKIEIIGNNGSWFYVSSNGTGVKIDCQAISMVSGTLTLERAV